jgi:nucleoside-diphosphate-sugar epimerase
MGIETNSVSVFPRYMPISMSGRVVLILGASSGIGRAAAVLFAREGAHVVAAARREARLGSLKQELAEEQCAITVRCADVTSPEHMQSLAQETLEKFGTIDILVYASGTNTPDRSMARLGPETWDSLIDANLNGAFYATHAVLPAMRTARSGLLIYISSMGGVIRCCVPGIQARSSGPGTCRSYGGEAERHPNIGSLPRPCEYGAGGTETSKSIARGSSPGFAA